VPPERWRGTLRYGVMNETLIPLVWDTGQVGSVAADARGILRLRHAVDDTMMRELDFAKGALKCPTLAPPYHLSPAIDAADVSALLDEFEWHSK
jgi:hypothetical protein